MFAMGFGFPSGVVNSFRRAIGAIHICLSMLGAADENGDHQRRSEDHQSKSFHLNSFLMWGPTPFPRCPREMTSCSSPVFKYSEIRLLLAYSLSHGIGSRRLSRSSGLAEDGAVAPHCDLPHRVDQNGKNSRRVLSPSSATRR